MGHILVTDGRQRSTLALARSLGRQGVRVTVGEEALPCLASTSRYTYDSFEYASPLTDPDGFMENLRARLSDQPYDMLIPMTDVTSYLIGMHQEELSRLVRIPMVNRQVFDRASDKGDMIHLARQMGVPVPDTHFVNDLDEVRGIAPQLEYPLVIKPRRSRYLGPSGWVSTRVDYAYSPDELVAKFTDLAPGTTLPLIQQRINGPGCGAFLLFDHGRPVAVFFHRRLREKPPSGGVSVLRESIPVDPQMKADAVRLLQALNWHGVAMVEFKRDQHDNRYKLMEINARFWGSLQLAIDAGVDFPYLLYQIATGAAFQPVMEYQVGVRTRWLLGDLDHLLIRLFKRNRALNLPEGYPGRLASIIDFIKPGAANGHLEIFKRYDIRPAMHETKEYLKGFLKI
jgi:predicted ATP-grasp superfamily ATP-dependent carboligase